VSVLPETKGLYRRWPGYALAAIGAAIVLLAAWANFHRHAFSPGEELRGAGFEDIAVSTEKAPYPHTDTMRFERRPEVAYVYVTIRDLRPGQDLEATVERSARHSVLSWILPGERGDLKVTDHSGGRFDPSEGGVSGVVRFEVRTDSGRPLPPGDYTVSVSAGSGDTGSTARKDFVIRG
jgi:hypothetical protein